jgi:hypothetical protein
MKYLYYNSTLIISAIIVVVLTFLKLYHLPSFDWIMFIALTIFTISLILKIFRSIKIRNLN